MKTRHWITLIAALGLLLLVAGCARQDATEAADEEPTVAAEDIEPEPIDALLSEGHFVLQMNGKLLLEEEFTIAFHPDEGYVVISQSTLSLGDVPISLAQQAQFDGEFSPISYQLSAETPAGTQIISAQMGLEGLTMEVRSGPATQDASIPGNRNIALLDNNLISHYAVLLLAIRDGAIESEFTSAIPQALLSLPSRFEGPAPVTLRASGDEIVAERFDIYLGDTRVVLVEVDGRLGVLANASQGTLGYDVSIFPEGVEIADLVASSVPPEVVREQSVRFENDGLTLEGTLAIPAAAGSYPAVLFLHGSGPVDRNGNAAGMPMDVYRQLAHALAAEGIASLRYDKRGVGASDGDTATASMSDLISDGVAAVQALREAEGVDAANLFLVGHSEGAYLAPQIALVEDVSGIALLAGAARPLDDITWWQIETLLRQSGAELAQIEASRMQQNDYFAFVENSAGEWADYSNEDLQEEMTWLSDVAAEQLRATPLGLTWLREHYTADTQGTLAQTTVPVLALNGEKDLQVPATEVALIAEILIGAGNEDVVVHALEDLNHLLRHHPEEPSLVVRHISQPVDSRVVELLLEWMRDIVGR